MPRAGHVLDERERHTHTGRREPVVPTDPGRALSRLAEPRADEWPEEPADVDAHVENRKSCVALGALLGVQVADDGADIWLEEAGPEHDEKEAEIERRGPGDRQAVVSECDEHTAVEHRSPLSDESIRNPSARQGQGVDAEGV